MMVNRKFRTLSGFKDYNYSMLNDSPPISSFERPQATAGSVRTSRNPQTDPTTLTPTTRNRFERPITIGLLALVVLALGFALRPQQVSNRLAALEYPPIVVSVSGEVARPGTYELPWGARTKDAIRAAGGTTKAAEASLMNPAAQLEDGEQLLVPARTAVATTASKVSQAQGATERINLNNATQIQLEALPGVGPKFATRLIAGRPYSSFEDVDRVKGVGPKMLEKLKNLVRF
jgi:comEA protein